MKFAIGLAAAFALAIVPLSAANAQAKGDKAQAAELGKMRERGMKDAPGLVQAKGYSCTVTDAIFMGESAKLDDKGKPIKGPGVPIFEVACQEGLGFIFGDPEPTPLDCLKLSTSADREKAAGKKVSVPLCRLPANADPKAGLASSAQKAGVACTVDKARWVGEARDAKLDQYEVGCSSGEAYLLNVPQSGSTAKLAAEDCFQVSSRGGADCEYFNKAASLTKIGQMASKSGKACQVTDAKWIGQKSNGGSYTEIACGDGKGFMVETDGKNAFVRSIDCAQADMIGGGCTLTKVATGGETADLPIYTRKMKEIGHPCLPSKYRSLGAEPGNTNREVVELACSNQTDGVFALVPLAAGAKGETYNCVRAEARQQSCKLTDKKAFYPQLSERLKAKGAACNVRETRGVGQAGAAPNQQDVVEVACDGGPGFMVIYLAGSEAVSQVTACDKAASIGGGCKLK